MGVNRFINDGGYVLVSQLGHPHNQNGYVLEHRLVVEQAIGRYLLPGEVVHHINEIKTDNRILNLYLCTPEEHVQIHSRGVKKTQAHNKKIRVTLREKALEEKKQTRRGRSR